MNWAFDLIALPALATLLVPGIGVIVPRWRWNLYTSAHILCGALALLVGRSAPVEAVVDLRGGPLTVQFDLRVTAETGWWLLLVALFFLAVSTFSRGYVQGARHSVAFLWLLLLGQAAANLVLEAGDLFALYGGLLVLSIVLASLVGLDFAAFGESAALRMFATLEVPSALALVSFWLIAARFGTVSFTQLSQSPPTWTESGSLIIFLPIAVALLARSGLVPIQSWVVAGCRAATAPAALTVAGLAVPLGGVVLARLIGVIVPTSGPWLPLLALLGASTAIVAGGSALQERSALGWLGDLAVGQVGLAMVGFALDTPTGRAGGQLGLIGTMLALVLCGMGEGLALRAARHQRPAGLVQQPISWFGRIALGLGLLALLPLPPFPSFNARWLILAALLQNGSSWAALVALLDVVGTTLLAAAVWSVIREPTQSLAQASEDAPLPEDYQPSPVVHLAGRSSRRRSHPDREILAALIGTIVVTELLTLSQPLWIPSSPALASGWPSFTAIFLLMSAIGGGLAGQTALGGSAWLNWLGWTITWGNRRLRLAQIFDPYVVIGSFLLATGQLSAGLLNQTFGRLARTR